MRTLGVLGNWSSRKAEKIAEMGAESGNRSRKLEWNK